jgi:hypothetical protein
MSLTVPFASRTLVRSNPFEWRNLLSRKMVTLNCIADRCCCLPNLESIPDYNREVWTSDLDDLAHRDPKTVIALLHQCQLFLSPSERDLLLADQRQVLKRWGMENF